MKYAESSSHRRRGSGEPEVGANPRTSWERRSSASPSANPVGAFEGDIEINGLTSTSKLAAAAIAGLACIAIAAPAAPAASSGGSAPGPTPTAKATLNPDGTATPPAGAPPDVVAAINAANEIEDMPYEYGGGHKPSFTDNGYDCSGAVSYALHAAGLLDSPLDSSGFMKWGDRGRGSWITVYTNPGHAYAVIAGLRWDTSMTDGDGPGWSDEMRSGRGFKKRNWNGL